MTRGMRALEPGTLAVARARSENAKIGDCATTYAEQRSCPDSCVFKDGGGCYAEEGPLGKFVTAPLNRSAEMWAGATPEEIAQAEANAIDRMEVRAGFPMRLHTVGDCATDEAARIVAQASARYVERGGGPVWTYTHAWRTVARSSWAGVHVLASCENIADVFWARQRGYATAIVVESFDGHRRYPLRHMPGTQGYSLDDDTEYPTGPDNEPVPYPAQDLIPCPAQTKAGVTCSSCRLCMDSERLRTRGLTIAFAIHGVPLTVRRAKLALADPDNPDRKLSSRVLIPRFIEEFEREHGRTPINREIAEGIGVSEPSVWEMRKSIRLGGPARPARKQRRRAS